MMTKSEINRKYYLKNKEEILTKMKARFKRIRKEKPIETREKDRLAHLKRKDKERKYSKIYRRTYKIDPLKYSARTILNNAIRLGKVVKPSKCEKCKIKKVQAHHPDYNEPLKVMWLCSKHHALEHHPL